MSTPRSVTVLIGVTAATALAVACGGVRTGNGQLAVAMVDAPNPAVDEIWVNVAKVRAHASGSGWITISDTPLTVDLLKLQTYAQPLGLVTLPSGTVTQLRLVLAPDGHHVVTGGQTIPLRVPSGLESGIKIVGPWEIGACTRTAVTIDFDGKGSLEWNALPQGDEWMLRPVIHTKQVDRSDIACAAPPEGCIGETCAPRPEGAPCVAPADCLSGQCQASVCAPGGADAACHDDHDCAAGFHCAEGACLGAPL